MLKSRGNVRLPLACSGRRWCSSTVSEIPRTLSPTLVGSKGEHATLPEPLYVLLKDIVRNLESGRSLVLMAEEQQLTTQRAAELLGMSRPYLIQLLNGDEMPYQLVGKHRRIALRDVLTYAGLRAEATEGGARQNGTRCVRGRTV
jgi:excisionase family DNA binding protein